MSKNEISVVHLSNCCTKTREDGTKYLCPKIVKIAERLKELKTVLNDSPFVQFVEGEVNISLPVLYLFYAQSEDDYNYHSEPLAPFEYNLQILPIIKDVKYCSKYIPEQIKSTNAMELKDTDPIEKLKNFVLRYFGLLDVNRKIFISYKRDDCEGLASKLYDELNKKNFVPFLDSYVIEPGVRFQEHLTHELSDSELMIFINSKNYGESKWCKEELAKASEMQVGIVQLCFDDSDKVEESAISRIVTLGNMRGKDYEYTAMIPHIIDEIERYRAMGFEIRRESLVSLLRDKYCDVDFDVCENGLLVSSEAKCAAYLLNRIPSSYDLQRAEKIMRNNAVNIAEFDKIVVYYGLYCRPDIAQHHNWLNSTSVPVKFKDISQ